ncbi:MAG TPA: hypothetical protein VH370_08225, partial [Humisphaera sp.]|nr:hypothetical protein [Humisphaera sp.]
MDGKYDTTSINVSQSATELRHQPLIGAPASLPPGVIFTLAALASSGTSLLITGIYFFMAHRYAWTLRQNFFLAASQGCVYIIGALNSHRFTARFKPRRVLVFVYALMAAIALSALLLVSWPGIVTGLLLLYSMTSVISWPILESQITTGTDSHTMSRRISAYNLVWAATGVAMLAIDGTIIDHWPAGIFIWPVSVHFATMLIVLFMAKDAGATDGISHSSGTPGEG